MNDALVSEKQQGDAAAPDQEATTEYLMNARLAEQRAKDAMLVARSMQAEIRIHHGRLSQTESQQSRTVAHRKHASYAAPISVPSKIPSSASLLDVLKEQEIVTMSMAWITDIFAAQQSASKI